MDMPPYASIILAYLDQMETKGDQQDALLCAYCTSFMKERVVVPACMDWPGFTSSVMLLSSSSPPPTRQEDSCATSFQEGAGNRRQNTNAEDDSSCDDAADNDNDDNDEDKGNNNNSKSNNNNINNKEKTKNKEDAAADYVDYDDDDDDDDDEAFLDVEEQASCSLRSSDTANTTMQSSPSTASSPLSSSWSSLASSSSSSSWSASSAGSAPSSSGCCRYVRRGRKHGMQLTVEHVLSGGTLPAPSRPHFLRCLAILAQSDHPFLDTQYGGLRDRIAVFQRCEQSRVHNLQMRNRMKKRRLQRLRAQEASGCKVRGYDGSKKGKAAETTTATAAAAAAGGGGGTRPASSASPHFFSVLHWLFEGRPRVFCDATLARNMRRWISERRALSAEEAIEMQSADRASGGKAPPSPMRRGGERKSRRRRSSSSSRITIWPDTNNNFNNEKNQDEKEEEEVASENKKRSNAQHQTAAASPGKKTLPDLVDGCDTWTLPPACRFCCAYEQMSEGNPEAAARMRCSRMDVHSAQATSYGGVLAFGGTGVPDTIERALAQAETDVGTRLDLTPGLMLFCIRCHRVAAVSYEYDAALRARLGLTVAHSPDAYYAHLIACSREAHASKKKSRAL